MKQKAIYIIFLMLLSGGIGWLIPCKHKEKMLSVSFDQHGIGGYVLVYTYYISDGKRVMDGDFYEFTTDLSFASKVIYKDGRSVGGTPYYDMASSSLPKNFFDSIDNKPAAHAKPKKSKFFWSK